MREWVVILRDDCSWVAFAKEAYDLCARRVSTQDAESERE